MKKKIIIVHGREGTPDSNWLPWLKKELETRGHSVSVPAMPDTDEPVMEKWIPHLAQTIGEPDENTILVGHSMGCQTIMRYLESLQEKKVRGIVLVAGFYELFPFTDEDDTRIAKPWLETPIDSEKIKKATNKIIAIFSDDDMYVPFERNIELFKERLGAKIVTENKKGHIKEPTPSILNAVLEIAE